MDFERLTKILQLGADTEHVGESQSACKRALTFLKDAHVQQAPAASIRRRTFMNIPTMETKIEGLQKEVATLEEKLVFSEQQRLAIETKYNNLVMGLGVRLFKTNADGEMPYAVFVRDCNTVLNFPSNWRTVLSSQLEIDPGKFEAWRKKNVVPADIVKLARDKLRAPTVMEQPGYKPWPANHQDRVADLRKAGKKFKEIAALINQEFHYNYGPGPIKRQFQYWLTRQVVLKLYRDGVRDPEQIVAEMQTHYRDIVEGLGLPVNLRTTIPENQGGASVNVVKRVLTEFTAWTDSDPEINDSVSQPDIEINQPTGETQRRRRRAPAPI